MYYGVLSIVLTIFELQNERHYEALKMVGGCWVPHNYMSAPVFPQLLSGLDITKLGLQH
jgi:hypothetical protein